VRSGAKRGAKAAKSARLRPQDKALCACFFAALRALRAVIAGSSGGL
jgi:hypothetical protein